MKTTVTQRRWRPRRLPGRPRGLANVHHFTLRLDGRDWERVQRAADSATMTVAAMMRFMVRRYVPEIPEARPAPAASPAGGEHAHLRILLSAEDHAHLHALAEANGVTIASLVRAGLRSAELLPADDGGNRARGAAE